MAIERLAVLGGKPVVDTGRKVKWPIVTDDDKRAVMRVLDEGPLWSIGTDDGFLAPETNGLEREFADFVGTKHCLAVNGGTAALHIALAAAGVEAGDEVITSAFSFLATPVAVLHQCAVPIFADIDPRTFNIDPADIERHITPRTKAILPVHIHGVPAEMDAINAIAKKHDLAVIEDACQAPGSLYKGRPAGSLGSAAAFSLNGTKNFSVGEGGLFVTDDDTLRDRANVVRMVGEGLPASDGSNRFLHLVAYNYRTQEMPSALARSQLRRLGGVNANARRNGEALSRLLADVPGMDPPYVPSHCQSTYHKYRVRLRPEALDLPLRGRALRDLVRRALEAEGVDTATWLEEPLSAHPIFQKRIGFGGGFPWSIHHADLHYEVDDVPETTKMLDESFVICSEVHPIYCQSADLMDRYAEACAKVMRRDALLELAKKVAS